MRKVFVDTNVVLDFLLSRESFFEDARLIMAMGYNGLCGLYMSSLSFSNIAYIARKRFTGDSLYDCFSEIRELLSVSPVTESEVDAASTYGLTTLKMPCSIALQSLSGLIA